MFVDQVTIEIESGAGGDGQVGFRREKYVPKGGPNGGNGGNGGSVIVKADPQLHTLLDHRYRRIYAAESGEKGGLSLRDGHWGKDEIIRVPCGTIVLDADTNEQLADLTDPGQEVVIAEGGKGGKGNAEFATAVRQTPRFAEKGKPGQKRKLLLELKLIADIGLVGFPNAGKSTLISVISAARPKIADYPFTTLVPNLGIVRYKEYQSFTVADLPGLIGGAHLGKGLGLQFLRHIERTQALVIMIDCTSDDYVRDVQTLRNELRSYSADLATKPFVVAVSKIDLADHEIFGRIEEFRNTTDYPIFTFSAAANITVDILLDVMWDLIHKPENFKRWVR